MSGEKAKKTFTILAGFVHDFAAGCWLATVLAVYWLYKKQAVYGDMFFELKRQFLFFGLFFIFLVFLAGAGRTFTYAYIGSVYGEESEAHRRKMLMIKHVLLLTVFGLGTWWQYVMVYQ